MALQQEFWHKTVQDVLAQSNAFTKYASDHSMYYNGVTVHVPNGGADPSVTKNNTSWPLTAAQRTDVDLTYSINAYSTQLILVTDVENTQVSYDKRMSVMGSHVRKIADAIGNNICYSWAPTSATTYGVTRLHRTSGALSGNSLASGATGNRQCITLADILKAKNTLDADLVPADGRKLLIPSSMMSQLLAIPDVYQQYAYGHANLPDGTVAKIYGFDIIERPNVVVYGSASTISLKTVNDAGLVSACEASDNLAAIAYHPDFVSIARGPIKVYTADDRPEYQGSVVSANILMGASKVRYNGVGICAIVQQ